AANCSQHNRHLVPRNRHRNGHRPRGFPWPTPLPDTKTSRLTAIAVPDRRNASLARPPCLRLCQSCFLRRCRRSAEEPPVAPPLRFSRISRPTPHRSSEGLFISL